MVESHLWGMGRGSRRSHQAALCFLGAGIAAAALCFATAADAQQVDDATRAATRQVGKEGLDAYDAGDYDKAAEKFSLAFETMRLPTLGLWLARSLERSGRLVEAAERYREVTHLSIDGGQQAGQRQAQIDAKKELEQLEPRIPLVVIQVEGASTTALDVTIDGVPVPRTFLNQLPRPTNPGERVIEGRLGEQVVTETVTLSEGQRETVVLRFTPSAAQRDPDARARSKQRDALRLAGYVSLGVGGVGLLVGSGAGISAVNKRNSLEDSGDCTDGHCYPSSGDDVDSYNSMRTISTIGFVVAGVGAATGVTLLLTTPKRREGVGVILGPGSAHLVGEF